MIPRITEYKINDTTFCVAYGDITKLTADVLVSSDDNYLSMGGGVSMALLIAGGEVVRQEARKHIPLRIGDVVVTTAGNLSAKYIFHAVTIDYENLVYATEESVKAVTLKCLQLGESLGIKTIVFPALGTGVAHFPFQLAAEVMTRTIAEYLFGNTKLEQVTITLYPRLSVSESAINVFYERATSLASLSTQSKRLGGLLAELSLIVEHMNNPALAKRVFSLRIELENAQAILSEHPDNIQRIDEIQDKSNLTNVGQDAVAIATDAHDISEWNDKKLEAQVLRTKLSGLLTQLNIQISNLNRYEIEKAKFGGQLVPPRLEIAIDEIKEEITATEVVVREVRSQLAQLGGLQEGLLP
jgi:O-acetyl-ADP-ribose deacetylase (regulator of RNase III)